MKALQSIKLPTSSIRKAVKIPLKSGEATFTTFNHLVDSREHIAIDFGFEVETVPMVRIHSECLTGDVFHSGRCDCGEQLNESLETFAETGGIVLYLRQEGRDIGLYNKIDAYALQLQGHDTYEANQLLGLKEDQRDYAVAAQMLKAMGVEKIKLLSNNPLKKSQLEYYGIEVEEQKSTGVFFKDTNATYLKAKVVHTKHKINLKHLKLFSQNEALADEVDS